jgi:hypothetical protein
MITNNEEPRAINPHPEKEVEVVTQDAMILPVNSNERKILNTEEGLEAVILPTSIYEDIYKAVNEINNIDQDIIDNNYTLEDRKTIGLITDGLRVTIKNNGLIRTLRDQEARWEQEPKYADKVINIRELAMGSNKPGGKITGAAAAARFYTELGLGGLIQIPLWHSGFHITLKAIKETELADLMIRVANNHITLGRETNTLIFSNYAVVLVRLIMEFITRHIQSCTLDLPNINDVTKFIKIQDIQPICNGLIQAIYLKGFNDVRSCINSLNLDKNTGKPECTFKMTSLVDPKKLLWLNRRELTDKHMEHMLKRAPNSMTENEVLEYQSTLRVNKTKVVKVNTDNGKILTFTLNIPFVSEHIISGEGWVKDVISLTEKLFTEDLDIEEKNVRVKRTSKMVLLNVYKHFIKAIALEDNTTVDEETDISELLEIITVDKTAFKELLAHIKDFIDTNIISLVAIPNFKCPECNALQITETPNKSFKDLIPINVLELFFDLSTLKSSAVSERNLD